MTRAPLTEQLALDEARDAVGMPATARYSKLAEALLAAPDPVMAIAHELGDQAGRIGALLRRVHALEARFTDLKERP